MHDYQFSDAQDLGSLNSTGVVSSNIFDLEEGVSVDQLVMGWVNGIILSTSNTGGDDGLWIEVRSADSDNLSTTPLYHGAILLTQDEIVAGREFSIGVYAPVCEKYFGLWYRAGNTSLNGATIIDAHWALEPASHLRIQKKNTSSGA